MTNLHRILLIEGQAEIGELIRKSLARQTLFEFTLEVAGTLKEGLALLSSHSFETLLVDPDLPDAKGSEVLRKVVSQKAQSALIVLTNGDDTEEGAKLMGMGAHNYLPKNLFDGQRLLRSILYSHELIRLNKSSYLSEERTHKVFDECPLGIAYVNSQFRFVNVNEVFCRMMGYTKEELLILTFKDITHKDHIQADVDSVQKMIRKKIPVYRTEKRYIRKDKKVIWGRLHVSAIFDTGGQFVHLLAMVEDITEQKKIEERLTNSETALKAILNASTESVMLIDLQGKLIAANETTARRLNMSPREMYTTSVYDLIPEKLAESRRAIINEAIREGKMIIFEDYRNNMWFENSIYPVIKDEQVIAVAVYATDITKRKQVEEANQRRENLLKSVLESAGAGILVVDNEGRITHSNTLFAKMWGIPETLMAEGSDEKLLAFVLEQLAEPQLFIEKVKNLYQSSDIDSDIVQFKDGRIYERLSYPLIIEGKINGRVWSFRDMTRLKNTETQLQKVNTELMDLNATKDKFFSIIAHDLRSPFKVLLGLSKILADPEEHLTPEDTKKCAGRIHSTLTNQFDLLQNLLEWARLQLGKVEVYPSKVNIFQIVANIAGLLSGNLLRKNIQFENDLDEFIEAYADPNILVSVLHNIISNAIKFTRSNGRITVSGKRTNQHLEIFIRDNGIGMSKEKIGQIFRLDTVSSTKGTDGEKGTGLGLILCKELVEKQRGILQISSEENAGTTVTLKLPYGKGSTRSDR